MEIEWIAKVKWIGACGISFDDLKDCIPFFFNASQSVHPYGKLIIWQLCPLNIAPVSSTMADKMYREYFDIDPKYYAAVPAELVAQGKVSWKGFLST